MPPHGLLFSINSKVFLYTPSHRQDNTYHGLRYTSRGALAGTRMPDGSYRLCAHLPKLNQLIKCESYPRPRLNNISS